MDEEENIKSNWFRFLFVKTHPKGHAREVKPSEMLSDLGSVIIPSPMLL